MNFKNISLSILALAFSCTSLAGKYYLGIGEGNTHPFAYDNFTHSASSGNAHHYLVGYELDNKWSFEGNYDYLDFDGIDLTSKVYNLSAVYRIGSQHRIHPFFKLGLGFVNSTYADSSIEKKDSLGLKAGFGLNFVICENFLFQVGLNHHLFEKVSSETKMAQALNPYAAVIFSFGSSDIKANAAESAPAPVAAKETPAPVAQKAVDTDGDGVSDDVDKCPGTGKGLKVNAYGCQENEKAVMQINVLFESGKSNLLSSSQAEVQKLASFMKENTKAKIFIKGYTDNSGTAAGNKKISAARANAVKAELVKLGIADDRVQAAGLGQADPIGDNNTAEGRRLNRRVMGEILESK